MRKTLSTVQTPSEHRKTCKSLLACTDVTGFCRLVLAYVSGLCCSPLHDAAERPDATQLQALLQVRNEDSEFFPVSCMCTLVASVHDMTSAPYDDTIQHVMLSCTLLCRVCQTKDSTLIPGIAMGAHHCMWPF